MKDVWTEKFQTDKNCFGTCGISRPKMHSTWSHSQEANQSNLYLPLIRTTLDSLGFSCLEGSIVSTNPEGIKEKWAMDRNKIRTHGVENKFIIYSALDLSHCLLET